MVDSVKGEREGKRVVEDGNYCPNLVLTFSKWTAYPPRVTMPLPAHHTKHLNMLKYPIGHHMIVDLSQLDDGNTNGTGLWLGAQCLSLFLADSHKSLSRSTTRPKAVELGSGIGLTAYILLLSHIPQVSTLIICLQAYVGFSWLGCPCNRHAERHIHCALQKYRAEYCFTPC